jgi:hypothetical protein
MSAPIPLADRRRWASAKVEGTDAVRRLNLSFFMRLGAQMDTLADFQAASMPVLSFKGACAQLAESLRALFRYDMNPMQLPATLPEATALVQQLDAIGSADDETAEGMRLNIWMQASKLQTILQGEMAVQAVYHIWPKRMYDINLLTSNAISMFSTDVATFFTDDEKYDIEQAGKCLAFEVPTAAAFHLMRLTESVVRRYYQSVVGTSPPVKMRNWGTYIKNLRKCGANEKVLFALEQVKEFYRNPVIHPDAKVHLDEAVSLLGIVESAISAMHQEMARNYLAALSQMLTPTLPAAVAE